MPDMIDTDKAREIASEWHGGQSSSLYAFSSSGVILPGILSEIQDCLTVDIPVHKEEKDSNWKSSENDLRDLRAYIVSKQDD